MRRLAIALGAGALAAGLVATPAEATRFDRCRGGGPIRCARVQVPLDRSGAVPGTLRLHVERVKARGKSRGAIFALAGGPGESASQYTGGFAEVFAPQLAHQDLVVLDQRGTGRSGALRCRGLFIPATRTPIRQGPAAARCGATLGPARAFYTTRDSVDDIEAVRAAVGVERITLFGVSYGTRVALAYAARYPQHVARLVLDSVLGLGGASPFYETDFPAMRRVLRSICAVDCRGISGDLVADTAALVARMRAGELKGPLITARGKRRIGRIGRVRLLDLLFAGDFDPLVTALYPASIRAALRGDIAPLLRIALRADRGSKPEPPRFFSDALFVATACEEGPLPWPRTTPPASRSAQAAARVQALPEAQLAPFDRETVLQASALVHLCRDWPSAPAEPALGSGPLPPVPTLLLAGEYDLRTPFESAQRVASEIPGATLVAVPYAGHSVLLGDQSRCAYRALDGFFAGRQVRGCTRGRPPFPPLPVPPRSLSSVRPVPGTTGRRGRTLTAVAFTLADLALQLSVSLTSDSGTYVGGLRAGFGREGASAITMHGLSYVPGVRISGKLGGLSPHGVIRVRGRDAAHGRLVLHRDGGLSGRLGGRRLLLRSAEVRRATRAAGLPAPPRGR